MACTGTLPLPLLAEGITHTPSESGDRSCQSRMLGWTSQAWEDPGVLDSAVSPIQNASAKSLTPFKGGPYGLPRGLSGKELTCSAGATGDAGSIPGSGRSPGGGHGNPLQYSRLGNPMDRGAWQATTHRVEKNQIRLKQLGTQVHYAFGSHFTERWMNMMEGVPRCALHPRRHSHLNPHLSPQEPEPRPHPTPAPPPTHSI